MSLPPLAVVIPTRSRADLLIPLVEELLEEKPDLVAIMDNGHSPENRSRLDRFAEWGYPVIVLGAAGCTVTRMWNAGRNFVTNYFVDYEGTVLYHDVAILNDDIRIKRPFLRPLQEALRADESLIAVFPNWRLGLDRPRPERQVVPKRGSARHGGLSGWAFMLKGESAPVFDESLQHWYADDDFAFSCEKLGSFPAMVSDVPCEHVGEATASLHRDEVEPQKAQDAERFRAKWGNI